MSADDLGSIWTSDPVRVTQSIKRAGKELDREGKQQHDNPDEPEREKDTVELSSERETTSSEKIKVIKHDSSSKLDLPGSQIDVTVE